MLITNIIAIVGCFTGLFSLFISTLLYFIQSPKVKVKLSTQHKSFYFNKNDFWKPIETINQYKNLSITEGADVMLEIINKSIHPLTVTMITARYSRRFMIFSKSVKAENFEFHLNEYVDPATGKNVSGFFQKNSLPFRMEPLDAQTIGIRFPISLTEKRNKSLHLYVYTPNRASHIKVRLTSYDQAVNLKGMDISNTLF